VTCNAPALGIFGVLDKDTDESLFPTAAPRATGRVLDWAICGVVVVGVVLFELRVSDDDDDEENSLLNSPSRLCLTGDGDVPPAPDPDAPAIIS
jgi:hypothetical protein